MDKEQFKEKAIQFARNKGFYAIMLGSIGIIGATVFITYGNAAKEVPQAEIPIAPIEANQSQDQSLNEAQVELVTELEVPKPTIVDFEAAIKEAEEAETVEDSAPKKQQKQLFPAPLEGDILLPFAKDELVYSKTLKQWTTHLGIDLGAENESSVKAIGEGVVSKAYNDPMLGNTLKITHGNGYESTYSSLEAMPILKEGDAIKANQIIGAIGLSALSECEMAPHLHFELRLNDKLLDPRSYLMGITKLN